MSFNSLFSNFLSKTLTEPPRRSSKPLPIQLFLHCLSRIETMAAPSNLDKEQIFGMAEKEMEYRVELFNKLTNTCFNKCVEKKYKESELNMGENSCIDRCVSKYWQVNNLIGQLLGSGRPPM